MATNVATLISRITTELGQLSPGYMSTATLNRRNELWVKALGNLEPFQTKEKAILANRSLSSEGQQQQVAKLSEDLLANLAWFRHVLQDLEAELAQQRTDLFTVEVTVKDDLLRYHRLREIRDRMAGLNQAERDVAYLTASQQDQAETLLALQDAPGGSWVTPDIQQRADTERAKHQQPDLFNAYTQNELLHEHLHSLADHLAAMLRSYGTPPAKVTTGLGMAA